MLLEQTIAFLTDSVGLERTLRFVHALLIITVNSPLLLAFVATSVLQPILVTPAVPEPSDKAEGDADAAAAAAAAVAVAAPILRGVLARISLTRALFRTFRFLDSFYDAHQLVMGLVGTASTSNSTSSNSKPTLRKRLRTVGIPLLSATSRFCNGVYLATDILLLADALDVPGLAVWAPDTRRRLRRVSQQHWFFALAASVAATALRLAVEPVAGVAGAEIEAQKEEEDDHHSADEPDDAPYVRREQQRLRRQVRHRKRHQRAWMRAARTRLRSLGRRLGADAVDLFLPGTNLGWLPVREPRNVGVLMLVSTWLTAWEVWERCGRAVAAADAAKAAKPAKEEAKEKTTKEEDAKTPSEKKNE